MFNLDMAMHFHNLVTEQYDCIIKLDEYKKAKNNLQYITENMMNRCLGSIVEEMCSNKVLSEIELPYNQRYNMIKVIELYADKDVQIKKYLDRINNDKIDITSYYNKNFEDKHKIFDILSSILTLIRCKLNIDASGLFLESNKINRNMVNINITEGTIIKLEMKNKFLQEKIDEIKKIKEDSEDE